MKTVKNRPGIIQPKRNQSNNALAVFRQGIQYLHSSNPSMALINFNKVYREAGDTPNLNYARAVALMQLNRPMHACAACQVELAKFPGHSGATEFLRRIAQTGDKNKTTHDWPENTYLVNHKCRLVYCPIPKVVCSNLKKAILKIGGFHELHGHDLYGDNNICEEYGDIHTCAQRECTFKVKSSLALNILEDHNFFKFAFVRNPWSRLVAGYLDKFVQYYAEIAGDLAELIAHVQEKSRSDLDLNKGVTFRQFVERVAGSRDMELDEHWRPQSCFVAYHKFDFIGKFENFQADVKYVNQQLGIELNLGHGSNSVGYASNIASGAGNSYFDNCYADELRKIKEDCGGFPDYKRFYPPDLRELVANKYQKDIEIFGYNFE